MLFIVFCFSCFDVSIVFPFLCACFLLFVLFKERVVRNSKGSSCAVGGLLQGWPDDCREIPGISGTLREVLGRIPNDVCFSCLFFVVFFLVCSISCLFFLFCLLFPFVVIVTVLVCSLFVIVVLLLLLFFVLLLLLFIVS